VYVCERFLGKLHLKEVTELIEYFGTDLWILGYQKGAVVVVVVFSQ